MFLIADVVSCERGGDNSWDRIRSSTWLKSVMLCKTWCKTKDSCTSCCIEEMKNGSALHKRDLSSDTSPEPGLVMRCKHA